jgi:ABC-2 type transport system permease protein
MYGLAELARVPLTGGTVEIGWVVNILAWLVVFVVGAAWRFRKDTARV